MASFEDYQSVTFDEEDNAFTIVRNSGKTSVYNIDEESELALRILDHSDEVDIYSAVHVKGYYRGGSWVRGHIRKGKY